MAIGLPGALGKSGIDVKSFERDLATLVRNLSKEEDEGVGHELGLAKDRLVRLRRENRVKINHSVLELLCAMDLIKMGYAVEVEHPLPGNLICDVYGRKGETSMIVEIETGFVPPTYALGPATYCSARIASKIARYSPHADKFALGTTPSNILPIPSVFQVPPRFRKKEDLVGVKRLCDLFYKSPPITVDQIEYARLHSIYILDLDNVRVQETSPDSYVQSVSNIQFRQPTV
jgi:hypothetical protein